MLHIRNVHQSKSQFVIFAAAVAAFFLAHAYRGMTASFLQFLWYVVIYGTTIVANVFLDLPKFTNKS